MNTKVVNKVTIFKDIIKGSKNAFQRKILKKYPIQPMMKQKEIRIIEELISNLKPKKVLEWGSGYSSLYYPKLIKNEYKWYSIEHDKDWYKIINQKNLNKNVEIKLIEPNNYNWKKIDTDGNLESFKDYVNYPKKLKSKFDLIIIDGRARRDCFEIAKKILNKNGIILIHDANRKSYISGLKFEKKQTILFKDNSKNHGGIFLYNEKDISKYLNIKEHNKMWKKYDKISKLPIIGKIILKIS